MIREKVIKPSAGWMYLALSLGLIVGGPALVIGRAMAGHKPTPEMVMLVAGPMVLVGLFSLLGLIAVQPKRCPRVAAVWRVQGHGTRIGVLLGQSVLFEEEDFLANS